MTTIKVSKEAAYLALQQAPAEMKTVLGNLFGMEVEITDWKQVTRLEDALKVLPATDDQQILLSYKGTDCDMIAARSFLEITIFIRAINYLANGNKIWEPDWTSGESKHYAWLEYSAGSGFSRSDTGYDHTFTYVGSRLCSKNSELAEHAAMQLNKQYNRLFTLHNLEI